MTLLQPESTIIFLCDVQTKFRPAIHGYDQVIVTANKMLKIAKLVGCEVIATTQNAKGPTISNANLSPLVHSHPASGLGPTDPAIDLPAIGNLLVATVDKTRFSMLTEDVEHILYSRSNIKNVILMGIETHVCVLQTALQLLHAPEPLRVYILYDGVASSHPTEMSIAIDRLRAEGAVITTSESAGFELVGDARKPYFREFSKIIKEFKLAGQVEGKM
ncbi:Isochorismatase hydrolase [Hymenopellis radicata]|nr:Isochorismatase hydrolase [Hymenopellis radicata]